MTNKTLTARIYRATVSGTTTSGLISTITDFEMGDFTWNLNAGLGELRVRLARSINDFGELDDVNVFNQFDVYVHDKESSDEGDLIYSGYIADYSQYFDGSNEYIDLTVWDYTTEFSAKVLEDGSGNTTLAYNSQDPSEILTDVFNRYDGKVSVRYNEPQTLTDVFSTSANQDAVNSTNTIWQGSIYPDFVDQEQTNAPKSYTFGKTTNQKLAQRFIPSQNTEITAIEVLLRRGGSPTDNITMKIVLDSGNLPNGALVATATNSFAGSSLNAIPLPATAKVFQFNAVSLTAGQKYWFILERDGAVDDSNFYQTSYVSYLSTVGYAGHYDGSSWTRQSYLDLYFVEYVRFNSFIAQSTAYDTGSQPVTYTGYSANQSLDAGGSITYEFSDSTDGVVWGAWTSDITTLRNRYIRFRATLALPAYAVDGYDTGPQINGITFNYYASTGGVNPTDTTVSYTFKQNSIKEALDQCVTLAPAYWYWRVGSDNTIVFRQRNTSQIDHTLMIGRDVQSIKLTRSVKNLANTFYFLGGGTPVYIKTSRESSQSTYGRRAYRQQDERVTNQDTAAIIAGSYLDLYDHPVLSATIEVADSNGDASAGYDIETLKPGQIVQILNPEYQSQETQWDVALWDVDFWDYPISAVFGVPFQIISVNWRNESAVLQLAYQAPDASKRIQDIKRNLTATRTADTPATPTAV